MQKKEKRKEKKKKKEKRKIQRKYLIVSHIIIYWDHVG